jgi:Type IV secretion system pilin
MPQWINKPGLKFLKTAIVGGLLVVAVFCIYFAFHGPNIVQAATGSQGDVNSEVNQGVAVIEAPLGLPATDIRTIIANIIRIALGLIGIVLVVLLIYAGFLWMTAGGNEEQIAKAKKTITNAVIGLIIILAAYAIVVFVMRMLGVGIGGGAGGELAPPGTQNFRGSGALGRIVKDHYPNRNQTNVPRNTKIVVSFFRPIRMNELAVDTNNTGIIGDCKTPLNDWRTDCDQMTLDNNLINIIQLVSATSTSGTPITGAAIMAAPSVDPTTGIAGVYTIVIRPYDYLGNEVEDVSYRVHLGNGIKRDDTDLGNPGVFDGVSGSKYYEWIFTCGTELDLSPPNVVDVYPSWGSVEYKNTVMQISFNEAMDPIGVQGIFATSTAGYYFLQNGFIYLKNENSTMPLGVFNLVNNYTTLEFTPSIPCGTNACGGMVFCMPVCDEVGASCLQDNYELILRAAVTINSSTFESQPFTGIADICGNALDGNDNDVVNTAPTDEPVFDNWKAPDNYSWGFQLKDEMDLITPIISKTIPGPEAPWVSAVEDWNMWFDKRMRIEPMYTIDITESPTPQERCDCMSRDASNNCVALPSDQCVLDLIWKVPFVVFSTSTPITKTLMHHGDFLDGLPQGYIPYVSSVVEDAHFNCLYPGQGPLSAEPYGDDKTSGYCDKNPDNCCIKDGTFVFCCNGDPAQNNPAQCQGSLLMPSI